ncbi:calcium-binding protein [Sphingomonas sp. ID0503]|uniref:calcium-binding protein n=1 Tax=Sphingomonas sp. ID0503 TaxID=3399691 RepID=UPI003AFABE3D
MAKFTVETRAGLDMDDFNLDFDGDATIANSTALRIEYSPGWFNDFFGTDFTYNQFGPTGGTLTGMSETYNDVKLYTISNASVSVATFLDYVFAGDVAGALALGFKGNDTFTGNAGADVLLSFAGNDALDGKGGADTLVGGKGNDTYIVDNAKDRVMEYAQEGTDTVKASVTHSLAANIENLALTGSGKINGTGNIAANAITGNAANNILDGGKGADTLTGGKGNDTYIVDSTKDKVVEAKSAGTDTVKAAVNFTLTTNVEHLTLTGKAALSGTGNTLANTLIGNDGANKLFGLAGNDVLSGGKGNDTLAGGAGTDKLTGGSGADRFAFLKGDTTTSSKTADHITDFSHAQKDRIDLSGYDANTKKTGVQDFAFVGTAAFKGVAGELRYEIKSGDTFVYGDTNGDKKADFMVILDPAVKLVAADFYFG